MYANFGLSVKVEDGCCNAQENFIHFQIKISYIVLEHTDFRICRVWANDKLLHCFTETQLVGLFPE